MSTATKDPTFSDVSAYGSIEWCAKRLGRSRDWFFRHRSELEADGFPPADPLVGYVQKEDVDAWLKSRRRISDQVTISGGQPITGGVDYGRF